MNQEEEALADYQQMRRQAEQATNDTYSEMQRQVQRFGETNEPMGKT
ncbi:MAG: hypothetical protein IC227_10365 [Enterococcus lacertideformus]|uniref:Uncharacterized protein n=1 Tax=Enterococcus lacertideformus TaxID=2771493 RepID=A0A931FCC3_9ENTE|nr:hypothetical protein [Enterococcus lacertideformus]